jgi:3-hydroxyisobutyrate dehydrogenase-like beta-hydroxyacid dehydrogenase
VHFVDSPVSGGPVRAKLGDLTMMASGDDASLEKAMPLLNAMGSEVYIIQGGAGMGSTVKV